MKIRTKTRTKTFKPENTYYTSVTLYDPDCPNQSEIARFTNFYEATDFITSNGYSIVYLQDTPQEQSQRWGVRQWTR